MVVTRVIDSSGYLSFAGTTYRVGNAWRGRSAQVAIVADSVQISCDGRIVRLHPIRHDRTKEHGAFATPNGRPRHRTTTSRTYRNSLVNRVPELDTPIVALVEEVTEALDRSALNPLRGLDVDHLRDGRRAVPKARPGCSRWAPLVRTAASRRSAAGRESGYGERRLARTACRSDG